MHHHRIGLAFALFGAAACSDSTPTPGTADGLTIAIAPLDLPAVGKVCYDLRVKNAIAAGGDTVWSRGTPGLNGGTPDPDAVCSDRFGNTEGGDITYIGPCDADGPGGQRWNSVTIWLDGLYDTTPAYISPTGPDGWRDPCPNGCTLDVLCEENEDTLVTFNLTVMREANQGFFDIIVNFEDVFCSAKLDSCDAEDQPMKLLFGGDQTRDWTAVFGFACTAGTDATDTTLLYGELVVDCGDVEFPIDPELEPGNQDVTVAGHTLNYAIYRDDEDLACPPAGSCKKRYWNLAFDLEDLAAVGGDCTLTFSATANDGNKGFSAGLPTAEGLAYPYIDVSAQLTDDGAPLCLREPLNGGAVVQTVYHGNILGLPDPEPMCHQFNSGGVGPTGGCNAAPPPPEPIACDRQVVEENGVSYHVIDVYVPLPTAESRLVNVFDVTIENSQATPFHHATPGWEPSDPPTDVDSFVALGVTSPVFADPGFVGGLQSTSVPPPGAGWFSYNPFFQTTAPDADLRVHIGRFVTQDPAPDETLRIEFFAGYLTSQSGSAMYIAGDYEIGYAPSGLCDRPTSVPEFDFNPEENSGGEDVARFWSGFQAGDVACYVDLDGNGTLDFFDVLAFLNVWGQPRDYCALSAQDIELVITTVGDADGSGGVDYDDMIAVWQGAAPDTTVAHCLLTDPSENLYDVFFDNGVAMPLVPVPESGEWCFTLTFDTVGIAFLHVGDPLSGGGLPVTGGYFCVPEGELGPHDVWVGITAE